MRLDYTKNAEMVISFAKEASETLGQKIVGTEHLLIGCLWEGEGLAAKVLKENGVGQEAIENLIGDTMIPDPFWTVGEPQEFTPRAEAVLIKSQNEAIRFKASMIGTEHILLSLLKEQDCVAVRLLSSLGINIQKILQILL